MRLLKQRSMQNVAAEMMPPKWEGLAPPFAFTETSRRWQSAVSSLFISLALSYR